MADADLLRIIAGAMAVVQNDLREKIEREVITPLRTRIVELEKQLNASERRARLFAAELVEKNAQLQALEAAPGAMFQ